MLFGTLNSFLFEVRIKVFNFNFPNSLFLDSMIAARVGAGTFWGPSREPLGGVGARKLSKASRGLWTLFKVLGDLVGTYNSDRSSQSCVILRRSRSWAQRSERGTNQQRRSEL